MHSSVKVSMDYNECKGKKYELSVPNFPRRMVYKICISCKRWHDYFVIPDYIPAVQRNKYIKKLAEKENYIL